MKKEILNNDKLDKKTWLILIILFILVIGFPIYVHHKNSSNMEIQADAHIANSHTIHNKYFTANNK